MGLLIIELADSEASADQDARQVQKQISRLYELLNERMLDMSSYVRTKVLSVFSRLCDIKKAKFPKQRLAVTRAAIGALEDKAATVRKNAVAVLSKLLLTHPYGLIHGGTLELNLFESQYKDVKDQLDKLEGTIGNAVDRQQGEDDDDDDEQGNGEDDGEKSADEEDEQEDEMAGDRPKRKGKKGKKRLIYALSSFTLADPTTNTYRSKKRGEDDMDVDEENANERQTDEEEEGNETEDAMDEDDEENSGNRSRKKKSKVQPRKSQLDVVALSNEQAALAALEGTQVLHLRLRKKYYAEALNFIRQIIGAMDTMAKLLGSTNKPEVVEAIEFFRRAHEYQFDDAQVCLSRS